MLGQPERNPPRIERTGIVCNTAFEGFVYGRNIKSYIKFSFISLLLFILTAIASIIFDSENSLYLYFPSSKVLLKDKLDLSGGFSGIDLVRFPLSYFISHSLYAEIFNLIYYLFVFDLFSYYFSFLEFFFFYFLSSTIIEINFSTNYKMEINFFGYLTSMFYPLILFSFLLIFVPEKDSNNDTNEKKENPSTNNINNKEKANCDRNINIPKQAKVYSLINGEVSTTQNSRENLSNTSNIGNNENERNVFRFTLNSNNNNNNNTDNENSEKKIYFNYVNNYFDRMNEYQTLNNINNNNSDNNDNNDSIRDNNINNIHTMHSYDNTFDQSSQNEIVNLYPVSMQFFKYILLLNLLILIILVPKYAAAIFFILSLVYIYLVFLRGDFKSKMQRKKYYEYISFVFVGFVLISVVMTLVKIFGFFSR